MMKNKRNSIVAAVMLLISPALMAQDTLRTDVIDVVKNYNATLSDAIKIKVLPNPATLKPRNPSTNVRKQTSHIKKTWFRHCYSRAYHPPL